MDAIIGLVISKPEDYRKCNICGAINWYEREICHNCGSNDLRDLNEADIQQIANAIENGIYCCDECPITV
ncbi:MAG: hypothetical protein DRI61_11390 [Chloroflexi bacterium]|nr:MAG: hypothetical protein DRI61_11390 [Chloroflexota bacterium]